MVQALTYEIKGHRKAVTIFDRDQQMIEFLWRHRVATFRTLYTLFYKNIQMRTCYNRLDKLRRQGLILTRGVDGNQNRYWGLDKRGMAYLVQAKGEIFKTMGFAPQSLNHDHFVSCVLLGDWFAKLPRGVTIITEQELLSLDLTGVAPGLQNDKGRRPDGLWRFEIGPEKKFLALEVELHTKSDTDYVEIIKSYDNHYGIQKIIWVAEGPNLIRRIFNLVQTHSTLKPRDHLFLLASEVRKDLWQTKFKNSELTAMTLAEYLSGFLTHSNSAPMSSVSKSLGSTVSMAQECSSRNVLMNFATCFVKSATYTKSNRPQKT
jgi:hypothetical protein